MRWRLRLGKQVEDEGCVGPRACLLVVGIDEWILLVVHVLPEIFVGEVVERGGEPRRPGDPDGPEEYHVVLLDNGRSAMLGSQFEDMLRCIRCGACMNHCPVYHAIGGHAYGWVYPGPMGAVLTPSLIGVAEGGQLPNASTFCGRCEEVCPMRIPLPKMMRHWREREFERHLSPAVGALRARLWAFFAKRPALYRLAIDPAMRAMPCRPRRGRFAWLPFAGGWTRYRDLTAPQGATFQSRWRAKSGASNERARRDSPRRSPLAACDGRRRAAPRGGRRAPRCKPRSGSSPPRPGRGGRTRGDLQGRGGARAGDRRRSRRAPPTFPPRSRGSCAKTICPRRCAWATTRASRAMPWGATALEISRGPSDGHDLNAVSAAFAGGGGDRHAGARLRPGQSDDAQLSARQPFRRRVRRRPRRRRRERLRETERRLRRRRGAAHAQFHHRPVALGRHRADAAARRARAAAAACRRRRRFP